MRYHHDAQGAIDQVSASESEAKRLWPLSLLDAAQGEHTVRPALELLLAVILLTVAYYFLFYVPKHARAGEPVLALANYLLTYSPIQDLHQTAYVIPESLEVWDTPAVIRARIALLKSGSPVRALGHFRDWTRVRQRPGRLGQRQRTNDHDNPAAGRAPAR